MMVDFFHYHLNFAEEKREVSLFMKVGSLQITSAENETFLFSPMNANEIVLDLDTGNIKNPQSVFRFMIRKPRSNASTKEFSVTYLIEHALGFEFEIEQAYEKALYYRAVRQVNAIKEDWV